MDILIEKAKPADAKGVIEYLKQVGGETDNLSFGSEGGPFTVEAEAQYLAHIYESKNSILLLAKENEKIIGCASLNRLSNRMKHRGDFSVTVLREYWNRGIGRQLMDKIMEYATENAFEYIDLQVRSDNLAAIHLYRKKGFVKIGSHPAFFKINGKDVAIDYMCLKL